MTAILSARLEPVEHIVLRALMLIKQRSHRIRLQSIIRELIRIRLVVIKTVVVAAVWQKLINPF